MAHGTLFSEWARDDDGVGAFAALLVEMSGARPVGVSGIDNDLSFGQNYTDINFGQSDPSGLMARDEGVLAGYHKYTSYGQSPYELDEIDRFYAQRIVKLAVRTETVKRELEPYLTPKEIDATIGRLTSLGTYLKPLLDKNNPRIKERWWPPRARRSTL